MQRLGPIRSALFVPGNRPDRIDKAMATKADAVIIDLEDAVPASEKPAARAAAAIALRSVGNRVVVVRINGEDTPFFHEDISAVLVPGLSGLMVPKVEDEQSILRLHDLMRAGEVLKKLEAVPLLALIESARAVVNIHRIAQTHTNPPRLHTLTFGAADYTSDLGVEITRDGQELAYPRARLAVACRAAGRFPPQDTPVMRDLKDLQALEADALRAKQLGFGGKLCIHPNQVDIVNRVFSPRPEEIRQAEAVVNAFEEAHAKGLGAIQVDGKFIDKPIVDRARQILLLARILDGAV
jgi:citrate lyase subunit beta/citryl-CoA lyase